MLAAGAFNSGVLAGGSTFDYQAAPPAILARRDVLATICARHGVPLAAAAIQFPRRHPAVTAVLFGARSPEEIAEDVRLLDHPVPEELWPELDRELGVKITALEHPRRPLPDLARPDGSDAMHPDPDYSAAYVVLAHRRRRRPRGTGFTFTIGRGNESWRRGPGARAARCRPHGRRRSSPICGGFCAPLTADSQLRWLGPEKGVIHLATAAMVNAVWDLRAKPRASRCGSCSPR